MRILDFINSAIAKTVAWLTLLMVLLTAYLVVVRYYFHENSIALQEVVMYCFSFVFMLGAAYTLQIDQHVRVDIFYRDFSARGKTWVNILGNTLFLIPFSIMVLYFSWDYAAQSWRYHESSPQPGGLQCVYLLKSAIPLFAILLILQAIAENIRGVLTLRGAITKGH